MALTRRRSTVFYLREVQRDRVVNLCAKISAVGLRWLCGKLKFLKLMVLALLVNSSVFAGNAFISHYVFAWEKNPEVVEKYLRASFDNPSSVYMLGNLYLFGTILTKDLRKADWYITKAMNRNLPEAINSIGDAYYSGDIRPKNIKKALQFYKRAANMGFGVAQFNAGIVLLNTAKSKSELKLAIAYLDKASKNRDDLGEIADVAKRYKANARKKLMLYQ